MSFKLTHSIRVLVVGSSMNGISEKHIAMLGNHHFHMVQVIALKHCLHRRLIGLEVLVHDVVKTNTQVNWLGFMNAMQLASGCGFNSSLGHVKCCLELPKFNAFNHVHSN
jgi:hypothetical protein